MAAIDYQDPDAQYSGNAGTSNPSNPSNLTISPDSVQNYFTYRLGRPATAAEVQAILSQYGTSDWGAITGAIDGMPRGGAPIDTNVDSTGRDTGGPTSGTGTPSPGVGLGPAGSLLQPFGGTFTNPTPQPLPGVPQFNAPGYTPPPAFSFPSFQAPSYADAANDPGYQFSLGQGEQALQQSAAARGVINGGGTLKDVLNYGQAAGAQQYGNVFNRALTGWKENLGNAFQTYQTNYQTQNADPYTHAFAAAQAQFAPQITGYLTDSAAIQRQNELAHSNAWDSYLQAYHQFQDQRDSTFNHLFQQQNVP